MYYTVSLSLRQHHFLQLSLFFFVDQACYTSFTDVSDNRNCYFADDSLANVEGVRQVLDAVDVKNKVQQALESKGEKLNKDFNKQLEQVTGKEAFKKYSDARARLEGQPKDKGFRTSSLHQPGQYCRLGQKAAPPQQHHRQLN